MKAILQKEDKSNKAPIITFIADTKQREKYFYKLLDSLNQIDGYTYTETEVDSNFTLGKGSHVKL